MREIQIKKLKLYLNNISRKQAMILTNQTSVSDPTVCRSNKNGGVEKQNMTNCV